MNFFDNLTKPVSNQDPQNTYLNFRVGQLVRIKRLEGGKLNCYKGYIGEIKEYKRYQNHALVLLHALNEPKLFRVPLDHFDALN